MNGNNTSVAFYREAPPASSTLSQLREKPKLTGTGWSQPGSLTTAAEQHSTARVLQNYRGGCVVCTKIGILILKQMIPTSIFRIYVKIFGS